jgi:hypothetical protein
MREEREMTMVDNVVAVWTDAKGIPERLVWHGQRFRVSDQPTPLEPDFTLITHPVILDGWRFQATDEEGRSRVFDVLFSTARQEWRLLRSYE